ncbi:CDP-diacylglycerol--glycerol-3-phosphate 3-phosphatidyltransferase [Thermobrachium celere]|uniref:CDP-diacylglycerol--glycerol-3-phosphate 3-phosphatidyltransferase n=1 Tax=Thermobrachium celere DSM 8682 TaxID=941824 RepID=R7RRI4_9CLOT|nr:CDP-diacylglycerol--glycerol-3-phosphate 3-phosphatidyltransferase [Thermobrachium celere]CDF57966.1 CDP-diacylglycerol--glycerol-3-phosphate 3-phosphatidyltransferase [Thermobrachium celere DSM 8682]
MNLANKITITRIFLVPVFLFFLLVKMPYGNLTATSIFIIAALTDTLDGYIARSRNQITKFGKFLDPLADKLIVTAALVALVELKKIPSWLVIIILAREFAITGLRAVAASEGNVIAASNWGKLKTITQIIAIIAALIEMKFNIYLMYIATIITIISGIDYIYKNRKFINSKD